MDNLNSDIYNKEIQKVEDEETKRLSPVDFFPFVYLRVKPLFHEVTSQPEFYRYDPR